MCGCVFLHILMHIAKGYYCFQMVFICDTHNVVKIHIYQSLWPSSRLFTCVYATTDIHNIVGFIDVLLCM